MGTRHRQRHTVSIDVDRPTVTLSNVPTVPQNGAFPITITFNEDVMGFVVDDDFTRMSPDECDG